MRKTNHLSAQRPEAEDAIVVAKPRALETTPGPVAGVLLLDLSQSKDKSQRLEACIVCHRFSSNDKPLSMFTALPRHVVSSSTARCALGGSPEIQPLFPS